jgi:aspartyl-tRNA synthetase
VNRTTGIRVLAIIVLGNDPRNGETSVMAFSRRTHTCGELRESHIGQSVILNGWVNTYRAQQYQVFVDLRDRYGLTQIVFDSEMNAALFASGGEVRSEWVLWVKGKVRERQPDKHNSSLPTGDIEVEVHELHVLNRCPNPPFEVWSVPPKKNSGSQTLGDPELANEDLRLQYRFLDLRRPTLQRTLQMRHRLNKVIRDYLDEQGFLELETPLLGRSTPEGARDYLVPSRVFPGEWYALPQSPQLYKQLLMVSGYDKYFQIARCLRDEDLRADRQPEFTQLDLEMSFVQQDDVLSLTERLTAAIFERCLGITIPLPLPRLEYVDAMLRYGSDKPDLRYGLEIVDCGDLASQTEFNVFKETIANGGKVRALNAKCALNIKDADKKFSRKGLDGLTELIKGSGAKGLAWIKVEADKFNSPIEKFLPCEAQAAIRQRLGAEAGDLLLFVADREEVVCQSLGTLRTHLASVLNLYDPTAKVFKIAWVLDFPSFFWDDEEKRWVANHHPFTAPQDEYLDELRGLSDADLARPDCGLSRVKAKAYDLVINGYECGGGSIRIHNPEVQSSVFRVLGMNEEQARARFGFLLDALKFGAPPHGGIALGLDRFAMMLGGTTNIRDVIAFPKNQRARDLMTGAPAGVDPKQLKELGLG